MKKLIVKFLESEKCLEHLSNYLCTGTNNFSDKLFSQLKSNEGFFLTIIPENTFEEFLYKFESGGLIITENSYPIVNPQLIISPSEEIIDIFFEKLLTQKQEINLGIKDINGQPDDEFVIEKYPFFKAIKDDAFHELNANKNSSFHLLNDYKTDLNKAKVLRKWTSAPWSPVFLFNLNEQDQGNLSDLRIVDDEMQSKIATNIFSIVINIYDDEGYLIWYKNGSDFILNDISQIIDNYNSNNNTVQTLND